MEIPNNIVELQELSSSINHLASSLNNQQLLRKRLTWDISHELRTPLTILQSHIEAISDGIWEPTQDKLHICKNEVTRLIKLVEELKHLTDIESHRLNLEIQQYSLSKDLEEVLESFRIKFQDKRIKMDSNIQKDLQIKGDRDKIKQVLIIVLSNALKFTKPEGRVKVAELAYCCLSKILHIKTILPANSMLIADLYPDFSILLYQKTMLKDNFLCIFDRVWSYLITEVY